MWFFLASKIYDRIFWDFLCSCLLGVLCSPLVLSLAVSPDVRLKPESLFLSLPTGNFSSDKMNNLSMVSWNVCGTKKLVRFAQIIAWLGTFSLIVLQETLEISPGFHLHGFSKLHVPAIATQGRPSGGLSTFVSNKDFGNYILEVLHSATWLLLVRVSWSACPTGILVGNVYIERLIFKIFSCHFLFLVSNRKNESGELEAMISS